MFSVLKIFVMKEKLTEKRIFPFFPCFPYIFVLSSVILNKQKITKNAIWSHMVEYATIYSHIQLHSIILNLDHMIATKSECNGQGGGRGGGGGDDNYINS